jgi:CRP/FNR family transcriptional regulator, cyclic AMP receptor protein
MNVEALRAVPLFGSLDREAAAELGRFLSIDDYSAPTIVFHNRDPGDSMYLIDSGKVRISITDADGHTVTLAELGPGDFFGEMSMLDGEGRSADATVVEDARLARLTRQDFLSFIKTDPRIAIEMLTALTHRLRRTDDILRHRVARNVNDLEAAQMTVSDHAADKVAEFGGSWKFILASIIFLNLWILANWLAGNKSFDPYPFAFLTLVLNLIQLLQAPVIMMSQNRQADKDRIRSNLDYHVNLKNEMLLSDIVRRLEELAKRKPRE